MALDDGDLVVHDRIVEEPEERTAPLDGTWYGPVTVPPDHVLVPSDQRDRTIDSRTYGPVPLSAVTGRVLLRLWPLTGRR